MGTASYALALGSNRWSRFGSPDRTVAAAARAIGGVRAMSPAMRTAAPGATFPFRATACGEAAHPDRDTAVRKALHEFVAARARKAFMHGPLDIARRATPPGYLDAWLCEQPPERMVEEERALSAMLEWTAAGTPALVELLRATALSRRSTVSLVDLPTWSGNGNLATSGWN